MIAPRPRLTVCIAAVVALLIRLGVSCNGFREDEIECEQAVFHLQECCPAFKAAGVDCAYSEELGCSDEVVSQAYPALVLRDSRCIQNESCSELVARGHCTRAQMAQRRVVFRDGRASTGGSNAVCDP